MTKIKPIILGIGNPLFQDEGFGIHIVHKLMNTLNPDEVEVLDGGTDGLLLLDVVERAKQLLVIDAVSASSTPGTVIRLEGNQIPFYGQKNLSMHQLSFQEVIALACLRERLPQELVLIGVCPKSLKLGTKMTTEVVKAIPQVIELINNQLVDWASSLSRETLTPKRIQKTGAVPIMESLNNA